MEQFLVFGIFLRIFTHNLLQFMPEVLYLHQTFTDGVFNEHKNTEILTCQMCLFIQDCPIKLRS